MKTEQEIKDKIAELEDIQRQHIKKVNETRHQEVLLENWKLKEYYRDRIEQLEWILK